MPLKSTKWLLTLLFFAASTSCKEIDRHLSEEEDSRRFEIPADQSSPEERLYIQSVLERIQTISRELGSQRNLTRLPIIVTTEDTSLQNREGSCHFDPEGRPAFIALNRNVIARDKPPFRASKTFGVLLHEIGHCYFAREHETAVLKKEGFVMIHDELDETGGTRWTFEEFSVSVMRSGFHGGSQDLALFVPRKLEKYYVAEILGLQRLNSLEELQALLGIRLVEPSFSLAAPPMSR